MNWDCVVGYVELRIQNREALQRGTNPCRGIERFKEKARNRYIEDWEYLAFKKHAGEQIAAYMDFKFITGLRISDVLRLRLDQLKDDGIHVTISKTGKRIVIKWSSALRIAVANVRKFPRPIRGMHLFCTRHGKPYTVSGFSSSWQRKMKSAVAKGVLNERFADHDLRRKTASDLDDPEHAQRLLGHASIGTTLKHYLNAKPELVEPGR
jgi:integrase